MPQPLFTPGKDTVPILQKAGWAPGRVWTGAENLAPTGIRSPDRPVRSQPLCRLRYPAHDLCKGRFTHIMPFPCRAHAFPLPYCAAKGLECVFPI